MCCDVKEPFIPYMKVELKTCGHVEKAFPSRTVWPEHTDELAVKGHLLAISEKPENAARLPPKWSSPDKNRGKKEAKVALGIILTPRQILKCIKQQKKKIFKKKRRDMLNVLLV